MTKAVLTRYLAPKEGKPARIRATCDVSRVDEFDPRIEKTTVAYNDALEPRENHRRAALTLAHEHDLLEGDMLSPDGYELLSADLPEGGLVHTPVPKRRPDPRVTRAGRWTLNVTPAGRIFALGGRAAFELRCFVDHDPVLAPSAADSLAGELLEFLNTRKVAS